MKSQYQVALLGLQSLYSKTACFLLHNSKLVKRLHIYDDTETEHISSACINKLCEIRCFKGQDNLADAILGADVIIIADEYNGALTSDDRILEFAAPKVLNYTEAIAEVNPNAFLIIAASPVNTIVPMVSAVLKRRNKWDRNKLLGVTKQDTLFANRLLAEILNVRRSSICLPIVGGSSQKTRVPLFSQMKVLNLDGSIASEGVTNDLVLKKDVLTRDGGQDEKAQLKATATSSLLQAIAQGLEGELSKPEITFSWTQLIKGVDYFSLPLSFHEGGIEVRHSIPKLSTLEELWIEEAVENLKLDAEKGDRFIPKQDEFYQAKVADDPAESLDGIRLEMSSELKKIYEEVIESSSFLRARRIDEDEFKDDINVMEPSPQVTKGSIPLATPKAQRQSGHLSERPNMYPPAPEITTKEGPSLYPSCTPEFFNPNCSRSLITVKTVPRKKGFKGTGIRVHKPTILVNNSLWHNRDLLDEFEKAFPESNSIAEATPQAITLEIYNQEETTEAPKMKSSDDLLEEDKTEKRFLDNNPFYKLVQKENLRESKAKYDLEESRKYFKSIPIDDFSYRWPWEEIQSDCIKTIQGTFNAENILPMTVLNEKDLTLKNEMMGNSLKQDSKLEEKPSFDSHEIAFNNIQEENILGDQFLNKHVTDTLVDSLVAMVQRDSNSKTAVDSNSKTSVDSNSKTAVKKQAVDSKINTVQDQIKTESERDETPVKVATASLDSTGEQKITWINVDSKCSVKLSPQDFSKNAQSEKKENNVKSGKTDQETSIKPDAVVLFQQVQNELKSVQGNSAEVKSANADDFVVEFTWDGFSSRWNPMARKQGAPKGEEAAKNGDPAKREDSKPTEVEAHQTLSEGNLKKHFQRNKKSVLKLVNDYEEKVRSSSPTFKQFFSKRGKGENDKKGGKKEKDPPKMAQNKKASIKPVLTKDKKSLGAEETTSQTAMSGSCAKTNTSPRSSSFCSLEMFKKAAEKLQATPINSSIAVPTSMPLIKDSSFLGEINKEAERLDGGNVREGLDKPEVSDAANIKTISKNPGLIKSGYNEAIELTNEFHNGKEIFQKEKNSENSKTLMQTLNINLREKNTQGEPSKDLTSKTELYMKTVPMNQADTGGTKENKVVQVKTTSEPRRPFNESKNELLAAVTEAAESPKKDDSHKDIISSYFSTKNKDIKSQLRGRPPKPSASSKNSLKSHPKKIAPSSNTFLKDVFGHSASTKTVKIDNTAKDLDSVSDQTLLTKKADKEYSSETVVKGDLETGPKAMSSPTPPSSFSSSIERSGVKTTNGGLVPDPKGDVIEGSLVKSYMEKSIVSTNTTIETKTQEVAAEKVSAAGTDKEDNAAVDLNETVGDHLNPPTISKGDILPESGYSEKAKSEGSPKPGSTDSDKPIKLGEINMDSIMIRKKPLKKVIPKKKSNLDSTGLNSKGDKKQNREGRNALENKTRTGENPSTKHLSHWSEKELCKKQVKEETPVYGNMPKLPRRLQKPQPEVKRVPPLLQPLNVFPVDNLKAQMQKPAKKMSKEKQTNELMESRKSSSTKVCTDITTIESGPQANNLEIMEGHEHLDAITAKPQSSTKNEMEPQAVKESLPLGKNINSAGSDVNNEFSNVTPASQGLPNTSDGSTKTETLISEVPILSGGKGGDDPAGPSGQIASTPSQNLGSSQAAKGKALEAKHSEEGKTSEKSVGQSAETSQTVQSKTPGAPQDDHSHIRPEEDLQGALGNHSKSSQSCNLKSEGSRCDNLEPLKGDLLEISEQSISKACDSSENWSQSIEMQGSVLETSSRKNEVLQKETLKVPLERSSITGSDSGNNSALERLHQNKSDSLKGSKSFSSTSVKPREEIKKTHCTNDGKSQVKNHEILQVNYSGEVKTLPENDTGVIPSKSDNCLKDSPSGEKAGPESIKAIHSEGSTSKLSKRPFDSGSSNPVFEGELKMPEQCGDNLKKVSDSHLLNLDGVGLMNTGILKKLPSPTTQKQNVEKSVDAEIDLSHIPSHLIRNLKTTVDEATSGKKQMTRSRKSGSVISKTEPTPVKNETSADTSHISVSKQNFSGSTESESCSDKSSNNLGPNSITSCKNSLRSTLSLLVSMKMDPHISLKKSLSDPEKSEPVQPEVKPLKEEAASNNDSDSLKNKNETGSYKDSHFNGKLSSGTRGFPKSTELLESSKKGALTESLMGSKEQSDNANAQNSHDTIKIDDKKLIVNEKIAKDNQDKFKSVALKDEKMIDQEGLTNEEKKVTKKMQKIESNVESPSGDLVSASLGHTENRSGLPSDKGESSINIESKFDQKAPTSQSNALKDGAAEAALIAGSIKASLTNPESKTCPAEKASDLNPPGDKIEGKDAGPHSAGKPYDLKKVEPVLNMAKNKRGKPKKRKPRVAKVNSQMEEKVTQQSSERLVQKKLGLKSIASANAYMVDGNRFFKHAPKKKRHPPGLLEKKLADISNSSKLKLAKQKSSISKEGITIFIDPRRRTQVTKPHKKERKLKKEVYKGTTCDLNKAPIAQPVLKEVKFELKEELAKVPEALINKEQNKPAVAEITAKQSKAPNAVKQPFSCLLTECVKETPNENAKNEYSSKTHLGSSPANTNIKDKPTLEFKHTEENEKKEEKREPVDSSAQKQRSHIEPNLNTGKAGVNEIASEPPKIELSSHEVLKVTQALPSTTLNKTGLQEKSQDTAESSIAKKALPLNDKVQEPPLEKPVQNTTDGEKPDKATEQSPEKSVHSPAKGGTAEKLSKAAELEPNQPKPAQLSPTKPKEQQRERPAYQKHEALLTTKFPSKPPKSKHQFKYPSTSPKEVEKKPVVTPAEKKPRELEKVKDQLCSMATFRKGRIGRFSVKKFQNPDPPEIHHATTTKMAKPSKIESSSTKYSTYYKSRYVDDPS